MAYPVTPIAQEIERLRLLFIEAAADEERVTLEARSRTNQALRNLREAMDAHVHVVGAQIQAFVDDFCQCPPASSTETRLLAERL
jgi:hypothetical protein